jgi:hypothetical protein
VGTAVFFKFPFIIIDEDFRSENPSGLGIRALGKAIEDQGVEVLGVTSYGDLTSFVQQQSRASCFILSIDDEEFSDELAETTLMQIRTFVGELRNRNPDIPIFLYGETRTSHHIPNDILRELHGFIHMYEDTPEFIARYVVREAKAYMETLAPPFFRALVEYAIAPPCCPPTWSLLPRAGGIRLRRFLFLALPRTLWWRGVSEKPGGTHVPPVLRREHAARRRV